MRIVGLLILFCLAFPSGIFAQAVKKSEIRYRSFLCDKKALDYKVCKSSKDTLRIWYDSLGAGMDQEGRTFSQNRTVGQQYLEAWTSIREAYRRTETKITTIDSSQNFWITKHEQSTGKVYFGKHRRLGVIDSVYYYKLDSLGNERIDHVNVVYHKGTEVQKILSTLYPYDGKEMRYAMLNQKISKKAMQSYLQSGYDGVSFVTGSVTTHFESKGKKFYKSLEVFSETKKRGIREIRYNYENEDLNVVSELTYNHNKDVISRVRDSYNFWGNTHEEIKIDIEYW